MATTISNDAIAKVLQREYDRWLTRAYKVIPFANRKYQWDIKDIGDTVIIPTIQIWDWQESNDPNRTIPAGNLTIANLKLKVEKYYDMRLTISDKDISLLWKDIWTTQEIVRQMREKAQRLEEDHFVKKLLEVTNKVTTPIVLSSANIFSEIVRIQVDLDKKDVPDDNRKLFVSPLIAWILNDSKKLENFPDWYKAVSDGEMWKIAWFTVVKTNALSGTNEKKLIWYQGQAGAFVEKLNNVKVKEASDWNYWNIVWWLFFDAWVLGENQKKVCIYEGA